MNRKKFEARVARIGAEAISESIAETADQVTILYGSPTQRLVAELGLYARHLRTWTCDQEDFGAVRPLRELLNDAALTISLQSERNA